MAMKPVKVSQLNNYIKRVLQADPILGNVSVIGEISNLKYHSTGVYFSLKDDSSRINCYIPPNVVSNLRYELDEGLEVIVYGYINIYEKGGTYSVNVRDIDLQGAGNLAIAFEKLKQKLLAEGLFDEKYKKPIPTFPEKIAVITSPTGAAVQDIKKIITGKNNYVDVLIYPVLVQGNGAAQDIANAIYDVNTFEPKPDVIIVGRGGGSTEELWAFNEEIVARAIFASQIPVISAVGHETDFTISDFVADKRAETPTAAAHIAAPDTAELKEYCDDLKELLSENLKRGIFAREVKLQSMDMEHLRKRLFDRIAISEMKCKSLKDSFHNNITLKITEYEHKLSELSKTMEALSPKNIMSRGYAAITDEQGKLISSTANIKPNDKICSILNDGSILSTVTEVRR